MDERRKPEISSAGLSEARRADRRKAIRKKRLRDEARIVPTTETDGGVRICLQIDGPVGGVESQRPIGIHLAKRTRERRQPLRYERDGGSEPRHLACLLAVHVCDRLFEAIQALAQHWKQRLSRGGQMHLPRCALEELDVQHLLQLADLVADGGRGNVEFLGSVLEAQPAGSSLEDAQCAKWRQLSHHFPTHEYISSID